MTPQAQTLLEENNCKNPHLCCMHKCDPALAKCHSLDSAVLRQIQCVCFVSTTENMDWCIRHLSPEHITGKQPAAEPKTNITLELISRLLKICIERSQPGRAVSILPLSSYRTIWHQGSYEYLQPITLVWLSFVSRIVRGYLDNLKTARSFHILPLRPRPTAGQFWEVCHRSGYFPRMSRYHCLPAPPPWTTQEFGRLHEMTPRWPVDSR